MSTTIATTTTTIDTDSNQTYYQRNRDDIIRKQKQKYADNREQLLAYQKDYNRQHRDQYLQKQKDWYQNNKEAVLAKRKQKVTCTCGKEITAANLIKHKTTKLHFRNMEAVQNSITPLLVDTIPLPTFETSDNLEEYEQIVYKKN